MFVRREGERERGKKTRPKQARGTHNSKPKALSPQLSSNLVQNVSTHVQIPVKILIS
jgi:hypothetical protein